MNGRIRLASNSSDWLPVIPTKLDIYVVIIITTGGISPRGCHPLLWVVIVDIVYHTFEI